MIDPAYISSTQAAVSMAATGNGALCSKSSKGQGVAVERAQDVSGKEVSFSQKLGWPLVRQGFLFGHERCDYLKSQIQRAQSQGLDRLAARLHFPLGWSYRNTYQLPRAEGVWWYGARHLLKSMGQDFDEQAILKVLLKRNIIFPSHYGKIVPGADYMLKPKIGEGRVCSVWKIFGQDKVLKIADRFAAGVGREQDMWDEHVIQGIMKSVVNKLTMLSQAGYPVAKVYHAGGSELIQDYVHGPTYKRLECQGLTAEVIADARQKYENLANALIESGILVDNLSENAVFDLKNAQWVIVDA